MDRFVVQPIGWVESPLHESAPDAWLVFESAVAEGLSDQPVGPDVTVFSAGEPVRGNER